MLIALVGKAGSGKSTVASMLQYLLLGNYNALYDSWKGFDKYQHWYNQAIKEEPRKEDKSVVESLASPIKEILSTVLSGPTDSFEDRDFKSKPNSLGLQKDGVVYTNRQLMQLVGTDCFIDVIDKLVWVKALKNRYQKLKESYPSIKTVIVSDVRMPHEAEGLLDLQPIFIYTHYISGLESESSHISESSIDTTVKFIKENTIEGVNFYDLENDRNSEQALFNKVRIILNRLSI